MTSRGWHRRGYLPHLDSHGVVQHLVFRLADALPPAFEGDADALLDAGHGGAVLGDPACARIVAAALLHFDTQRYALRAWCVMPNHVHALALTFPGHDIGTVVRSWKAFSAARINERLNRRGRLWAPDYFDRFMRDDAHFLTTQRYIERNPVAAGLCAAPEDWPFGSAGWKG